MTDDLPTTIKFLTGTSPPLTPHAKPMTCEIRMKISHWASYKALQAAEQLSAGEAYEASGYMFVDELGRPLTGRILRTQACAIMAEHALRRVRLFDARASCFTYLANNGVPEHLLARWAGRTNVKTTKQWYVKPDIEDLRPAAQTWEGLASPTPSCERWQPGRVTQTTAETLQLTAETLQYRFDGPEDAPVLVLGPSLGTTWHM
ncbi:hypothetical protein [Streptomyces sp. NPDC048442]|uniref:hypothetical protein n=1 Tax=Streptomyces sp. NPDC048442 TaxID=3154823 RepID=UPI003436F77D